MKWGCHAVSSASGNRDDWASGKRLEHPAPNPFRKDVVVFGIFADSSPWQLEQRLHPCLSQPTDLGPTVTETTFRRIPRAKRFPVVAAAIGPKF
jgi:hypothetical protein